MPFSLLLPSSLSHKKIGSLSIPLGIIPPVDQTNEPIMAVLTWIPKKREAQEFKSNFKRDFIILFKGGKSSLPKFFVENWEQRTGFNLFQFYEVMTVEQIICTDFISCPINWAFLGDFLKVKFYFRIKKYKFHFEQCQIHCLLFLN